MNGHCWYCDSTEHDTATCARELTAERDEARALAGKLGPKLLLAETALGVAEVKLDRAQQEIAVLRGQIEDVENACEDWCRQANEQRERAEKVGAQALGEHDERIVAGVAKNLKSVATGDTDGSEYGGVVKGSG